MATHILTVDRTTFETHVDYMFLGTGKNNAKHQAGAQIDILGIRPKDNIIFYVMNCGFFGIFEAVGKVFYDYNSYAGHQPQYLNNELGGRKTLTYRLLIKPKEVYQNPLTEWDMMENPALIKNQSIYNLQWSWIFKKLNASRGCLAIDNYEFNLYKTNLALNNIKLNSKCFKFNKNSSQIITASSQKQYDNSCTTMHPVTGKANHNQEKLRLETINNESDLRRLFSAEAGINPILDQTLKPNQNGSVNFISNEVLCSFSERKIDLLFGTDKDTCILIELKNYFVFDKKIYYQLMEYSRWISAYKKHYKNIIPILIIKEPRKLSTRKGSKYFKYLSQNNLTNNVTSQWYNTIIQDITRAKQDLANENIARLSNLQVYTFNTDSSNRITGFNLI